MVFGIQTKMTCTFKTSSVSIIFWSMIGTELISISKKYIFFKHPFLNKIYFWKFTLKIKQLAPSSRVANLSKKNYIMDQPQVSFLVFGFHTSVFPSLFLKFCLCLSQSEYSYIYLNSIIFYINIMFSIFVKKKTFSGDFRFGLCFLFTA